LADRRGPRMRKLEPTAHPSAEAAPVTAEKPRRGRFGRLFKRIKLPGPVVVPLRFIGKILRWLVPRYLRNAWRELRLVTWPSRRESWRLTGAVFIFAIVFGVLVTIVDRGFDSLFKHTILK